MFNLELEIPAGNVDKLEWARSLVGLPIMYVDALGVCS